MDPATAIATVKWGETVWRAIAPWKRLKVARNKRRARLGKPLLHITEEDYMMTPPNSVTHSGAALAGSSPLLGFVVTALVPHIETKIADVGLAPLQCGPVAEAVAAQATQCVTAGVLAYALVTGFIAMAGGAIASYGRQRAEKRHQAALAAANAAAKTTQP